MFTSIINIQVVGAVDFNSQQNLFKRLELLEVITNLRVGSRCSSSSSEDDFQQFVRDILRSHSDDNVKYAILKTVELPESAIKGSLRVEK